MLFLLTEFSDHRLDDSNVSIEPSSEESAEQRNPKGGGKASY